MPQPQDNIVSKEIGKNLLNQVFEFWVNPEIERRRQNKILPKNFKLRMAQIVMNVGKPPIIRLNDEIKAQLVVRVTRNVVAGDPVSTADIDEIENLKLTEDDPDAGHITIILHKNRWFISFNFHYNSSKVRNHIEAAHEFLETAQNALTSKRYRAFYENIFCAVELISKAWLLRMPVQKLLSSKNHSLIHSEINRHAKLGNIYKDYSKMFNEISEVRPRSRYLNGKFVYNHGNCEKIQKIANEMYSFVCKPSSINNHPIGESIKKGTLVPIQS